MGQLLAAIAVAEVIAMGVIELVAPPSAWMAAALDAALLTLFVSAPLWWIVRDTARRLEGAERERLAARTATILATAVDGIVVTDARGRILTFNRGAEAIFGYREEEMLGQSVSRLLPPAAAARHDAHVQAFAGGTTMARQMNDRGILHGRHRSGREIPVEVSIAKSSERGEQTLVAVIRDVSERERVENELRAAKELAEAGARAKSEFLANMSHEIRTPMNAVIGLSDLLAETPLTAEQREYIETIRTSGDSLLTILNDILDYSKIEAGRLEFEHQPFDLRHCVESALDLFAPLASHKRLDLAACIESDVPAVVEGDVTRVRQVIVNLVGNAVKFTAAGEVVVHVRSEPQDDGRARLTVAVRDTGIGIPPERRDRLFQVFSQVDSSTARRYGGTGLGLAICHRLVTMMGGAIRVDSNPGGGSVFSFSIVLPVGEACPLTAPGSTALRGLRVLVVDDNATNRLIVQRQLESFDARPVAFASGPEALAWLEQEHSAPDLAVLDLHMPGMDGLELARALRAHTASAALPLMLVSSSGTHVSAEVRSMFRAIVPKPLKSAALIRGLHEALGHAASPGPGKAQIEAAFTANERAPRILLAEDNAVNQKVAIGLLRQLGCTATVVANGREALEAARRVAYDIVLMDVHMPEMSGLDAARELRSSRRSGPSPVIVALTAGVLESDRADCLNAGMDDFLPKPLRLAELRAALRRAMQRGTRSVAPAA